MENGCEAGRAFYHRILFAQLVDEDHNFTSIQASTQPWTEIRYAEVLLNHAEACYHLNGYTDKANKDIKDIRNRVGLSYTDKSGNDLIKPSVRNVKWNLHTKDITIGICGVGNYLQQHLPVFVFME